MKTRMLLAVLALSVSNVDVGSSASPLRRARCRAVARNRVQPKASSSVLISPATPITTDQNLFDGQTLAGWTIIEKYDFERHGEVKVEDNAILLAPGTPATGIRVEGDFPRLNYEVTLDAKRIEGADFFCGITFPVGEDYLSLVLGGWGGGATGISNLDNMSAIENETTGFHEFEQDRWYRIRLRVTDDKVEAWVDDEQIVGVEHAKHKLSIWWEQEPVRPFGIASWYTKSALRNIRLTHL
jgi:hypothetical protein